MTPLEKLVVRIYPDIASVNEITSNENSSDPEMVLSNLLDINGTFYRQLPYGGFCKADPITDADTRPFITATWLELPELIRSGYVVDNWPDIQFNEYLLMVHGEEEGQKIIDDFAWATSHEVYNTEITFEIEEKIGRFSKIIKLGSGFCFPNHTNFDKSQWYQYLLDDRWIITVTEHSKPFNQLEYIDMLPSKFVDLLYKFEELADVTVNIVELKSE